MANKKQSNKMRTRKHQKGGAWYNPMTWGKSDDPNKRSFFSGWFDSGKNAVSGVVNGAEGILDKGTNAVSSGFNKIGEGVSSGFETVKDTITGTKTGEQEQVPVLTAEQQQEQVPELTPQQKQEEMDKLRLMQGQREIQEDIQMQPGGGIPQSAGRRRKSRKSKNSKKSKKTRKSRKSKKTKGGSKLGLTYYATPVQGLKVAQPSYWEVYGDGHIMAAGTKRKGRKKC